MKYRIVIYILMMLLAVVILVLSRDKIKELFHKKDENNDIIYVLRKLLEKCFEDEQHILKLFNLNVADQSYTINKKDIYLCISDKRGNPYDLNMLIYVTLHEVAHVLSKTVGHTDEFHEKFNELLDKAEKKGIFSKKIPLIDHYCPP